MREFRKLIGYSLAILVAISLISCGAGAPTEEAGSDGVTESESVTQTAPDTQRAAVEAPIFFWRSYSGSTDE